MAALAWQLAPTSRVWRKVAPETGNSTEAVVLRQLELDVRAFQWSMSEDAKDKSTAPEPMELPGEGEARRRLEEDADRAAVELAIEFGLNL